MGGVVVWVVGDATTNGSETGNSFRQALHFIEIGFNLHDTMIYHKKNPVPQYKSKRYTNAFEYMFVLSKGSPNVCNYILEPSIYAGTKHSGKGQRQEDGDFRVRKEENKIRKDYKIKSNVWSYVVGKGHSSKDSIAFKHPAIYPEELAKDHILSWSNEGDIVFDPMCGSGTTCKIAKELGRKFIGIDISQEYVDIAKIRLELVGDKDVV